MKRWLRVVPVTVLLVILAGAHPAYATFAEWLDKLGELSGPGPFIQRAGVSVDLICTEGRWWKDPRSASVVIDGAIERSVLDNLTGTTIDNPFVIANAIQALTMGLPLPGGTDGLRRLYDGGNDKTRIMQALQQRARTLFWELREQVLNTHDARTPEDRLTERLKTLGIDITKLDQGATKTSVTLLENSVKIVFTPFCVGDLRRHRVSIGVYSAWFVTDIVPADYVYSPDVSTLNPRINAAPLAATVRTSLPFISEAHPVVLRSWDIGASIGGIFFSGERMGHTLSKAYIEIPRITVRPLAFASCRASTCPGHWTAWDLLEAEFVVKGIPGVSATDFGAASGPSSDFHWNPYVRVGISVKFNRDQTPRNVVP